MIKVEALDKIYENGRLQVTALKNVNLNVSPGNL